MGDEYLRVEVSKRVYGEVYLRVPYGYREAGGLMEVVKMAIDDLDTEFSCWYLEPELTIEAMVPVSKEDAEADCSLFDATKILGQRG